MNATTEMPKTVRKLKAENICKCYFTHPTIPDCHCLYGWCNRVSTEVSNPIAAALLEEINAPLTVWNDRHTSKECADLWNRTMLKLGYIDAGDHFELPEGVR